MKKDLKFRTIFYDAIKALLFRKKLPFLLEILSYNQNHV